MTGTLVGPAAYPSADRFDESAVELGAYDLVSRYEDAAALLEDASLSAERIEPSPASLEDLRLCCSDRRLRRLLGAPSAVSESSAGSEPESGANGTRSDSDDPELRTERPSSVTGR